MTDPTILALASFWGLTLLALLAVLAAALYADHRDRIAEARERAEWRARERGAK